MSKICIYGIVVQLSVYTFAFAIDGEAQNKSVNEIRVSIDLKSPTRLNKVIDLIEKNTDFNFSQIDQELRTSSYKVNVGSGDYILSDLLLQIARQTELSFHRVNDYIQIRKKESGVERVTEELELFIDITGKVTDENGDPLPGATILEKGTTNGTITDAEGSFTLSVEPGTILLVSFVGYESREVTVSGESFLEISLKPDLTNLGEVVVVGYGTQKKVTVTGAVTAVEGKELVKSPAVDISNSLAGRLPGLVVIQTSGEPGYDGARVNIRGTNTLGNSEPLIVIDGIPDREGGLGRLSPQDIESISVLKDASAAIYGARAANGAILITTKRGKSGKPTITYDFNQGWSQPTVIPEMSSAVEYAEIMNELPIYQSIPVNEWEAAWNSISGTGTYDSPTDGVETLNAQYSPEAIQRHADGSDTWLYPDTDWFGDAFKTWSPQSRHNLSLSGGGDRFNYYASLGYIDQDAYYKNSATRYKQYSFRVNLDAKVSDYINAKMGVMSRREDRNFPTESAGSIFRMLMRGRPTEPAIWPNGLPGPDIENGQNPIVITTNATGYQDNPTDFVQANGTLDITNPWVDGLKLSLSAAIDKTSETNKRWQTPWELYYLDRDEYIATGNPVLEAAVRSNFTDPRLRQSFEETLNTNFTSILSYEKTFGDHSINLMAGATREKFTGSNFFAYRRNYISPAVDQLFVGGTDNQDNGGSAFVRPRMGYYGRAQYNFQEKYLVEFIWRYDGSYIFPEADRFGFFPGLLLGWNVTNEEWFNVPGLDYLKLRGSYGQMGNDKVFYDDELKEYAYLSVYDFGEYPINQQVQSTLYESILANPTFTWEKAKNYNFGLDATIFSNFDVSLEYFYNKREDILIALEGSTPASSGIANILPPKNAGRVDNRGFEYDVRYNGQNANLRYSVGLNGGFAKNEVIYMDEIPGAPKYQHQEGKPIGAYLVYKYDGVFRDQEEIANNTLDYSEVTSQLLPGDMKFKDVNGDGVIDADDQVRLEENATPTFNFGGTVNLYYKNFDFSMLLQGATGASIRVQTESGDIGNFLKYHYDNRWHIDDPSSEHPRLASRGDTYFTGGSYGNNTYYLFSKDYIRIKNIELGYTLPTGMIDRIGLRSVRLYVNALNLLTFDKHNIFDPESENQAGTYYPQARVINTGISVSF